MTIDTTELERVNTPGGMKAAAIVLQGQNQINSTVNGNLICDQGAQDAFMGAIDTSNGKFTGTFDLTKQLNGGNVGTCP